MQSSELNGVTSDDISIMDALSFTEEQQRSAIGNCVVDSMVKPLFVQLTQHVRLSGGCSTEGGVLSRSLVRGHPRN